MLGDTVGSRQVGFLGCPWVQGVPTAFLGAVSRVIPTLGTAQQVPPFFPIGNIRVSDFEMSIFRKSIVVSVVTIENLKSKPRISC